MPELDDDDLAQLAGLLRQRNALDAEIAALIGRPAERGHVGEWIAARLFGIKLHDSATRKGSDGVFVGGPLNGREVNVKMYGYREGVLDTKADHAPDFYLVLTGPKRLAATSRGTTRPLVIDAVYLFSHDELTRVHRVKGRTGASVRNKLWEAAMLYPNASATALLRLDERQAAMLRLFATDA